MLRGVGIAVMLAAASAPIGWLATDALESRNGFCVSCHLDVDRPLHRPKMDDFERVPARSLAAAHAAAESGFRCIDCHGGASFPNKVRVKSVAARDAAAYLLGWFEEPTAMEFPLWDEDCVQCHARFEPERSDAFHAFEVHNVDFDHRCVECHGAHATGAPAHLDFLDRDVILPVCRNCHEEF